MAKYSFLVDDVAILQGGTVDTQVTSKSNSIGNQLQILLEIV